MCNASGIHLLITIRVKFMIVWNLPGEVGLLYDADTIWRLSAFEIVRNYFKHLICARITTLNSFWDKRRDLFSSCWQDSALHNQQNKDAAELVWNTINGMMWYYTFLTQQFARLSIGQWIVCLENICNIRKLQYNVDFSGILIKSRWITMQPVDFVVSASRLHILRHVNVLLSIYW